MNTRESERRASTSVTGPPAAWTAEPLKRDRMAGVEGQKPDSSRQPVDDRHQAQREQEGRQIPHVRSHPAGSGA